MRLGESGVSDNFLQLAFFPDPLPPSPIADSLTWECSGEAPARQCLITRGLLPLLAEGSARATDSDTTDEVRGRGSG